MRIGTSIVLSRVADSIGEESSSVNEGSSSFTRSVFDALKAPTLSDLTWKRSVHCNLPPKGKHTSHKKFSEGKQEHVGMEALKTNQTR